MAILSKWHQRVQQWTTSITPNNDKQCSRKSSRGNRRNSNKFRNWIELQQLQFYNYKPWRSVSIYDYVSRSWGHKSDCNSEGYRGDQRNGHYKYLYPVALCLTQLAIAPATLAADGGGVSATANPIANSSGSVTNQAIQVLQGPYITNTYGGGISCQGPTMNFTPYVTHSISEKDPFEQRYFEPQYDARDFEGRTVQVQKIVKNFPWETWYDDRTYTNSEGEVVRAYEDGADMPIIVDEIQGDGVPDNPGSILWEKPVRTGEKINFSTNIGFSATVSFPLDGGLQERCKTAADTQIGLQQQMTANKRLDFEIARLKNCGELMKAGIYFKPGTKYAAICADVMVQNVNVIAPHRHVVPRPISSLDAQSGSALRRGSSDAVPLPARPVTVPGSSFPLKTQPSSGLSSQSVSPLLTKDQQEVLRVVPKSWQPLQSKPLP